MTVRTFLPHLFCLITGIFGAFALQAQPVGARQPPSPEQQRQLKTEAQEALAKATSDTARVRLKMQIAGLTAQDDFPGALQLAKEALTLAEKTKHPETIVRSNFGVANMYIRANRYDDALQYLTDGLPAAEKLGNADLLSAYYSQLGRIYHERGVYEKSLLYYRKTLDALEKIQAPPSQKAGVLNQIGMLLQKTGKHREALDPLQKAAALAEQAQIWDMAAGGWTSVANCHDALSQPEDAEAARAKAKACQDRNKKKATAQAMIKSGNN